MTITSNIIFKSVKGDKVIWAVVIILSLISVLAVYSSTGLLAYRFKDGNTEYYLFKHFFILAFGLVLMYIAHLINYTFYSRLSRVLIMVSVPLLVLTFAIGTTSSEASRWLNLPGINLSFQTSDFAKLTLIIYLARLLAKKQEMIKDFKQSFIPIMLPILTICGLILPSNLSTAAILFTTCFVLMFIGRVSIKYMAAFAGVGIALLALFILIMWNMPNKGRVHTWKNRIENFTGGDKNIDPDKAFQSVQSKIAISTGGIIGKLPGNSTQRNILPQAFSDFIFAIIVEEYGLIGGIVIVGLYLILLFRAVKIATKCTRIFPALLTIGCAFSLVFQAMIHMGIASGVLPVTGQPLPLLSMGGTSIWFTSIAIGIILSVSKSVEVEVQSDNEEEENNKETAHATA